MTEPGSVNATEFAARLEVVRARIAAAAPEPEKVTLVAVSKKFPAEVVSAAREHGLLDFGENYAQELIAKAAELETSSGPPPRWHFIGGLQRNKVKKLAAHVDLWHTVDRPELVDEIAKRAPAARILIQVNTTQEVSKSGCEPPATAALVERGRLAGLDVAGLMTLGPTDQSSPQRSFDALRSLSLECEVVELSMGMSADLEIAVAAGATLVRVGSALFGPRSTLRTRPCE